MAPDFAEHQTVQLSIFDGFGGDSLEAGDVSSLLLAHVESPNVDGDMPFLSNRRLKNTAAICTLSITAAAGNLRRVNPLHGSVLRKTGRGARADGERKALEPTK